MSSDVRYRPRSLAVVGASPSSFVGRVALENCRSLGFAGRVVAVTPKYAEVADVPAVPSLADLDEPVDAALVQVRADRVLGVVEQGLAAGVRTFVIPGAGTTDSGDVARELVQELRRLRDEHGLSVFGPNCMGVLDLVTGAAPYIGTVGRELRRGTVGLAAQSGAVVEAFVNAGARVPLSTAISSGSEAVLGLPDHLRFFAADPETTAVLAFVEAVDDAGDLLAACRALADAGKTVAACVVGRSATAQEGVRAHSGRLAGAARTTAAALAQAGAVLAHDLDELIALGEVLGTRRHVRGRRTHLVTNSGGEANLLADLADDVGLELPGLGVSAHARLTERWPLFTPRNPMDPWGADDHEVIYPEALRALADEGGDLLVVGIDQQRTAGAYEQELGLFLARTLRDAVAGSDTVPVLLSPAAQDPPDELAAFCAAADIPLLRGARPSLAALAALAGRAEHPPAAAPTPPRAAQTPPSAPMASELPRTEDEVLAALAAHGLDVPRTRRVTTAGAASAAFAELGAPVVLKGVAEGLLHKTEVGLVRVGLSTPQETQVEAAGMLARAAEQGVTLDLLVAELVRGDLEVLVGFHRDPAFGPTVLLGLGGVWAEFLDVVDVHVGDLDECTAHAFLDRSRIGRMVRDARGGALDRDGVVRALCAVSRLGASYPEISAIDVNPVIVSRTRAVAVDAALTLAPMGGPST
ncbi:acetate--CoA ligase family protein [Blastococcus sp. BMG 814]|uniref:Acetate--CoA ligase family protein n=1 Tax=Blastococcus carthaginiensis TaxID=3050034 RepID=A0ABT9IDE7_9ACTN|nr:acetate--CoA ligase family protein [Blastococcus carthaginiensis]MDP5183614.1 acetate--CoA ligase family protein [Blastococcus carthaginiensis]